MVIGILAYERLIVAMSIYSKDLTVANLKLIMIMCNPAVCVCVCACAQALIWVE